MVAKWSSVMWEIQQSLNEYRQELGNWCGAMDSVPTSQDLGLNLLSCGNFLRGGSRKPLLEPLTYLEPLIRASSKTYLKTHNHKEECDGNSL